MILNFLVQLKFWNFENFINLGLVENVKIKFWLINWVLLCYPTVSVLQRTVIGKGKLCKIDVLWAACFETCDCFLTCPTGYMYLPVICEQAKQVTGDKQQVKSTGNRYNYRFHTFYNFNCTCGQPLCLGLGKAQADFIRKTDIFLRFPG